MKEVQMNDKPTAMTINQALVFDGMVFASMRDRNRYASTETRFKPLWLQQNPDRWMRLQDIPQPAAQLTAAPNVPPLSPTEPLAKDEIVIGGRFYVSAEYLASKMDISTRTLARRCENGKGPPHVKIAGIYFERDPARQWAKDKGLRRSRRILISDGQRLF
jgi:hypothetical protein